MPVTPLDGHFAGRPPEIRESLERIRTIARAEIPGAEEKLLYGMPCFVRDGHVLFFEVFRKHVGLFPPVRGDARLQREVARYRGPKGNLQLPLDEPIPYDLVRRVVHALVKEHEERRAAKALGKKATRSRSSATRKLSASATTRKTPATTKKSSAATARKTVAVKVARKAPSAAARTTSRKTGKTSSARRSTSRARR